LEITPEVEPIGISHLPIAELLLHSTMTLATSDRDGEPHAAAVYFATDDDLNFYFFSDLHSQHGQDLLLRPQCAVAIYPECQDWQDIRGLQLRGEACPLPLGPEWEHAWSVYTAKFPFVSEMRELVARNQLYVFIPTWVRLVDNRRGFGFKQEWCKALLPDDSTLAGWQAMSDASPEAGTKHDRA
jgi:hypothetical protein